MFIKLNLKRNSYVFSNENTEKMSINKQKLSQIIIKNIYYDTNCNIFSMYFFSFKRKDFYLHNLLHFADNFDRLDSRRNLGGNISAEFKSR